MRAGTRKPQLRLVLGAFAASVALAVPHLATAAVAQAGEVARLQAVWRDLDRTEQQHRVVSDQVDQANREIAALGQRLAEAAEVLEELEEELAAAINAERLALQRFERARERLTEANRRLRQAHADLERFNEEWVAHVGRSHAYTTTRAHDFEALLSAIWGMEDVNDFTRAVRYLSDVGDHRRAMIIRGGELATAVEEWRDRVLDLRRQRAEEQAAAEAARERSEQVRDDQQTLIEAMQAQRREHEALLAALDEDRRRHQGAMEVLAGDAEELLRALRAQAAERARAAGAGRGRPDGVEPLLWPTDGPLSSRFGQRRHPVHGDERAHHGIDIAARTGTPVLAAAAGRVVSAGPMGGYGLTVVVDHGNGVRTVYAHLSGVQARAGARVRPGQTVGQVGSTGVSTGPHLHFEVRVGGAPRDPLGWFH